MIPYKQILKEINWNLIQDNILGVIFLENDSHRICYHSLLVADKVSGDAREIPGNTKKEI